MKQIFFVCTMLLTLTTVSFAQKTFGVKGGLNFANLAVDKDQIDDANMKLGYSAGIFTQLPLAGIHWLAIQPELTYSVKGAKYNFGDTDVKANLQYLDIPVLAVARIFNSPLTIHAGPQFSFLTRAKYEYDAPGFGGDTVVDDEKSNYRAWDLGLNAGIGLDIRNLLIEARVSRGLRDVEEDKMVLNTSYAGNKTKNFVFQLTAGIRF